MQGDNLTRWDAKESAFAEDRHTDKPRHPVFLVAALELHVPRVNKNGSLQLFSGGPKWPELLCVQVPFTNMGAYERQWERERSVSVAHASQVKAKKGMTKRYDLERTDLDAAKVQLRHAPPQLLRRQRGILARR
jgi:hypothetical protein